VNLLCVRSLIFRRNLGSPVGDADPAQSVTHMYKQGRVYTVSFGGDKTRRTNVVFVGTWQAQECPNVCQVGLHFPFYFQSHIRIVGDIPTLTHASSKEAFQPKLARNGRQ